MKRIFVLLFMLILYLSPQSSSAADISSGDKEQLLLLLKACADITEYDSSSYNEHELMLRMLYTYRNFTVLSDIAPQSGGTADKKLLNSAFVDDAMYRAFRIKPEHPDVSRLTELGYCYSGGYYYYTGGYSGYFATDVKEIKSISKISDSAYYIVFTDTFTDSDTPLTKEESTAVAARDDDGFYLTELHMGGYPNPSPTYTAAPSGVSAARSTLKQLLPVIILLLTLAAAAIVFYTYII
ncbi:MAG: hypothetical protein PUD92_00885 [Clostridiales bacterium]|nr:hypothetical protein [Clostridiales bacterium]